MIRRSRTVAAAAVAVACLLPFVGCDPGSNGPTSSPTPTMQSSPPETSLERQQRLDFEAAEKSYRAFVDEYNRLLSVGGTLTATPTMKENATGKYLQFYVTELRDQKQKGLIITGANKIGYVKPGAYSPQQLTIGVCDDGSNIVVKDRQGKVIDGGQIVRRSLYFRPVEGRWKIWNGDDQGVVQSCNA